MTIYGTEKCLGAMYEAKGIENNDAVRTNSVAKLEDEDDECHNCGECKCFSCKK